MNKDILKKELDKLGVNPNEYSLNGNIESDKIVLYQNYSKWEVFYFDERGGRNCEKVFCNEGLAHDCYKQGVKHPRFYCSELECENTTEQETNLKNITNKQQTD